VIEEFFSTTHHDCQVTGRLGQVHCDLIEATLFTVEKFQMVADGGMAVLIDQNKLRKTMSENKYSYSTMMNLFEDIRGAKLKFWPHGRVEKKAETEEIEISGGIIDHILKSTSEERYNPLFGKIYTAQEYRSLDIVRFNVAYITLLSMDEIKLFYDPRPIINLRYGISKAITRHVLSHSIKHQPNGGWKVDTLIHAVAGEITGQALWDARRYLNEEVEALKKIGILIEDNRIIRLEK
jgi:hypothetical protein